MSRVAVKVLHPHVTSAVKTDLRLMSFVVSCFNLIPGVKYFALQQSLGQFTSTMIAQLDLRNEGQNLLRFTANFADYDGVLFPPYIASSRQVLIEGWESGEPLSMYLQRNDSDSARRTTLAKLGLHAYLKMMFKDNLVHADMHPGNLAVRWIDHPEGSGKSNVQLIMYDVGLVTEASPKHWSLFKQLLTRIVQGDGRGGAELMIKYSPGAKLSPAEAEGFRESMHSLFDSIRVSKLNQIHVGGVLYNILNLLRKYHVEIEGSFATLCVGTAVLEGIGRQLDPSINLLAEAIPYLVQYILRYYKVESGLADELQPSHLLHFRPDIQTTFAATKARIKRAFANILA